MNDRLISSVHVALLKYDDTAVAIVAVRAQPNLSTARSGSNTQAAARK